MSTATISDAAKAVVRRNTEEVQGRGNFDVFEELFADNFVDHTPQPGMTPDKAGVRKLYTYVRAAFPDFSPEIHWQLADGDRVTTYQTSRGTHEGPFLGIAPTHRRVHFETVDVMRVQNGKITDHWGAANLLSLMRQIGRLPGRAMIPLDARVKSPKGTHGANVATIVAEATYVPEASAGTSPVRDARCKQAGVLPWTGAR